MTEPDHWETVYTTKASDSVSWFQATPETSLAALSRIAVPPTSAIIDVGGGASALADSLLDRGWADVTILDVAAAALEVSQSRLGTRASQVQWIAANITQWSPARQYDIWHDRAVFHFLATKEARDAYKNALHTGLRTGGWLIMATFALDGPDKCSGLPVIRYNAELLTQELGHEFTLVEAWSEEHKTPWNSEQCFNWCVYQRR
ncbi:class I SAM-dependent methyltransferase [Novosphingobium sp. G106]|uniref:class I SAM-dependent methyltransferase n=1 Tax=Novosphingobium sp. G106 TaxID=2849500 RepID=UPI001C2DDEAE|nr:class I SAM-dependent methyltransferase [Novosphingobium sp. G106]MBV1692631.1 class I SAM-dependent methyltransferase [Novosphingobium sp. G106]